MNHYRWSDRDTSDEVERLLPEVTLEAAAAAISADRERRQHEAVHPAVAALGGHEPFVYQDAVLCDCEADGDYRSHVLDLLTAAHLLMDTRRPYTGPIPAHDPTWANEAHPQGAVGAPGAVASYAERMGWTEGQASSPVEGQVSTWPEPYPTRTPFPPPSNGCGCWRCWDDERPPTTGSRSRDHTLHPVVMHFCGDCGSKRCARAGNHRTKCQEVK